MSPLQTNPTQRIVFLYLMIGLLWIFLSDAALTLMMGQGLQNSLAQSIKGMFYVGITASLFYLILRHEFKKRARVEGQYYALFFANPMPMAVYDLKTLQIVEVNQALANLYGYSLEEFILQKIGDLKSPDKPEGRRKDGSVFPLEINFSDTHLTGFGMAVVIDLSERRQMENLEKDLAKERELRQLKNRFVSMFAHDFRTPLTVIMTSVGMLEGYPLSEEERHKKIQKIYHGIRQINQMLEDMMMLNQSETGKVEFNPDLLDLDTFCHEIIDIYKSERNIEFKIEAETPSAWLDSSLMHYILTNLLSNAIKYSPAEKAIKLDVFASEQEIIFRVQDFGMGIPAEDQAEIFNPFKRGSNAKHIPGTGLGLVIVQEYVEIHQGSISFESQEQIGTTFTVKIPRLTPTSKDLASKLIFA